MNILEFRGILKNKGSSHTIIAQAEVDVDVDVDIDVDVDVDAAVKSFVLSQANLGI